MNENRFSALFEQASLPMQIFDTQGLCLDVNEAWCRLWGAKRVDVIGYNVLKDPQAQTLGIANYIRAGLRGESVEMPPVRYDPAAIGKPGRVRWASMYVFPIKTGAVISEVAIVLKDMTAEVDATEELKNSRDQLRGILSAVADAVMVQDQNGKIVYANQVAAQLCGFSSLDEFLAVPIEELLARFEMVDENLKPFKSNKIPAQRVFSGEATPPEVVIGYRTADQLKWSAVSARPIHDENGRVKFAVSVFRDITEQRQKQSFEHFLSDASALLYSSLDYRDTLKKLCRLVVPELADWCAIEIPDEKGEFAPVDIAHVDPEYSSLAFKFREKYRVGVDSQSSAMARVFKSGKAIIHRAITDEMMEKGAQDAEHLALMKKLKLRSAIIAPLKVHGRVLGTLTIVSGRLNRFTEHDMQIVEELGSRAAIAIENSQLFSEMRVALQTRDEFLSIASHELKTPLTSLKLRIEIAMRNLVAEKNSFNAEKFGQSLSVANRQVDRLALLVEDLLDVSRINAGRLRFVFEEVDLSEVVSEVADRYRDQLKQTGSVFDLAVEKFLVCECDRLRAEQIVVNLVSNAIKYGAGKPVQLTLRRDGDFAVVAVRDSGVGIPPESHAKIFERFERAVTSENYAGLGLGLYIVKQIVAGHHGSVAVESQVGAGSLFTVKLPLRQIPPSLNS